MIHKRIQIYRTPDGQEPFIKWLNSLDSTARKRIYARLDRLRAGYYGDFKSVGGNILELRFRNPALRIYFQEINNTLVLLLCGGKKNSNQSRDIARAKTYAKQWGMMEI